MKQASIFIALIDNGGRRLGADRRQFSYTDHIPDRRSSKDRRQTEDRRIAAEPRSGRDRRDTIAAEQFNENMRSGIERRNGCERRAALAPVFA